MCAMGWGTPTGCVSVTGRVCVCVCVRLEVSGCVCVGCIGARHVCPRASHFPVASGCAVLNATGHRLGGVLTEPFPEAGDREMKHQATDPFVACLGVNVVSCVGMGALQALTRAVWTLVSALFVV